MPTVRSHQENANQTALGYHFTATTEAIVAKTKIASVILDEDTSDPIFIPDGVAKYYSVQNSLAVPHTEKRYHVTP